MAKVIVLFDANTLINTPFHSAWWRVLALARHDWGVKICIPKVSFEELAGHAERAEDKLLQELQKVAAKAGDTPGFQAAAADLQARRDAVRPKLVENVEAIGAELIDPVDVPAMNIVERQVRRGRPCKPSSGDGFRDTLNWLTVLAITADNPGEEVAWVSADTDFAAHPRVFHPELLDEATVAGVADRLSLWPSLSVLVQDLLKKSNLHQDVGAAHLALVVQAVQRYVAEKLHRMLMAYGTVSHDELFFPPDHDDVDVKPAAMDGDGWPFAVDVQVISHVDGVMLPAAIHATGMVTTDELGKPVSGGVSAADWMPEYTEGPPVPVTEAALRQIAESQMLRTYAKTLNDLPAWQAYTESLDLPPALHAYARNLSAHLAPKGRFESPAPFTEHMADGPDTEEEDE